MIIARVGANLKILRFIIGKAWFRGTALLPAVLTGLIPNIYFFTHAHTGTFGNVWGASRQSVQACKQCSTFARYESNGVLAFLHVSPPTLSPQLQRKYSNNPWNESIMSFRSPSSQSPASQFVSDFAGPPMANPHVRRLLHWAPSSAPQPLPIHAATQILWSDLSIVVPCWFFVLVENPMSWLYYHWENCICCC